MFYEDAIYRAAFAAFKRAVINGDNAAADAAEQDLLALGAGPDQLAELRSLRLLLAGWERLQRDDPATAAVMRRRALGAFNAGRAGGTDA